MSKLVGDGGRLGLATTLVLLAIWLSTAPGLAAPGEAFGSAVGRAHSRAVPNEVIVGFRHGASAGERERAVAAVDGRVKKRLRGIDAVLVRTAGSAGRAIERLERRGGVRYAEPNFRLFASIHGSTPNDPEFHRLWGLDNFGQLVSFSFGTPDADIDALEAWGVTTGGGTVVGVLDTGIDLDHPDLAANIWTNAGESCAGCRTDGVDNDGNGYVDDWRGWDFAHGDNDPNDDQGHGTHVAGTIAAAGDNGVGVAGVNWSAKLIALKFIGADGSGTTADAIAALLYATANGAAVTNNSYGSAEFSQAFADAVETAGERGSLFVAAAGNSFSSNDASPQYPASFTDPSVLAVAATNNMDQRAWFSNYGARSVDLGAPGDSIYSTWPGGGYELLSGTSMASPQVAGAAALVQAAFPGASAAGTKALLLRSVDPNAALAGKTTSGGRLNVNAAVRCDGAGQVWLESPAAGFVAPVGEELQLTALAAGCGRAGDVTVTATANGAPIDLTARAGGLYDGAYAPTGPGPLSLSVTAVGPGGSDTRTVSGSVPAAITAGGPPVTVTAAAPDDNPLLTFDATAGDRISLQIGGVTIGPSTCCSAKISILGPDGSALGAPTYVGTSGGFVDTKVLTRTGTHSIVVDPQGSATGSATLTLHAVPPDAVAAIVPGGPAASVTTTTPGQNAALSFDASAGDRVSANIGPVCCNAKVTIVGPDGSAAGPPAFVSPSGGFMDARTLKQSGRHTIVVDPSGTAIGGATLTLYAVPLDATKAIVPGGPSASLTTTVPGQNAKLTFSGTAGQRISMNVGPGCCNTYVSVAGPDGAALGFTTYVPTSGGFVEPKTLPQTGAYTVLLDHYGAAKGSSTVSVYDVPADATATISPGGPPASVATTTPGQNAKLSFSGTAGRRVSLKIAPACCGLTASIAAPDGSTLGSASSFTSTPLFIDTKTLTQTGTYTIPVDLRAAATGSVTLTLYDVPADVTAAMLIAGPPLTVAIPTPGQNAAVTFDGTAGRGISLQVSDLTIAQSKLLVRNPDGTDLIPTQYLFTVPRTFTAQLPATGTYTIFVDPQSSYAGSLKLTLP